MASMASMTSTALGLRAHSGWAALVALEAASAGDPAPRVILRSRVEIAGLSIDGSRQPYHEAEGMPLAEAAKYLAHCEGASFERAREGLAAAITDLPQGVPRPRRCAILLSS